MFSTSTPSTSGTYTWNLGNGQTSNSVFPTVQYTANGTYVITLTMATFSPACSSSVSQTININNVNGCALNANFSYINGVNQLVHFNNQTTGTVPGTTYLWQFGDGTTSPLPYPMHTYPANGVYTATLTANNNDSLGCTSSMVLQINVTSTCMVNANFSLMPSGTPQHWFAIPSNVSNVTNAVWSWGDGNTSNTLYANHTYSISGTYTICLSVTVSCGGTDTYCNSWFINRSASGQSGSEMISISVIPPGTVGLEEKINPDVQLSVYPNPNSGKFILNASGLEKNTFVRLHNMLGEEVYSATLNSDNGTLNTEINAGNLSDGIYFIKLDSGATSRTIRLVVTK